MDNEHGISITDDPDHDFSEMIDTMIAVEESDNPSTSEEADAQTGSQTNTLDCLPDGLFAKVLACNHYRKAFQKIADISTLSMSIMWS